jgi:hypothetical protein
MIDLTVVLSQTELHHEALSENKQENTMIRALIVVLLSMLFPGAANAKEAWAVVAYIQDNGTAADNQVFYDVSQKGQDDAVNRTRAACEAHAQKKSAGKYRCEVAGTCADAGWSAIASYLKSGGRIGTSCRQETQDEAVAAAKRACGSGTCAKIFTYEIKPEENGRKLTSR